MLGRTALRAAPELGRASQRSGGGCRRCGDRSSGRGRQGEGAEATEVGREREEGKEEGGSTSQGETLSLPCAAPSAVHSLQPAGLSGRSARGR